MVPSQLAAKINLYEAEVDIALNCTTVWDANVNVTYRCVEFKCGQSRMRKRIKSALVSG